MPLPSSSLLTPADETEASISISFAICLKMNSAIADLHMFPWHTNMMFTALTVSEKEEADNLLVWTMTNLREGYRFTQGITPRRNRMKKGRNKRFMVAASSLR